MIDLSVNLAGLALKNPFIVSSAETARDIRQIKKAEKCGASAVVLKAMGPAGSPLLYSKLRTFVDFKGQAVYGGGGSRWLSYDQGAELVRTAKQETGIKIGVNMAFPRAGDYQYIVDTVNRMAEAGADFIELNFKGTPFSVPRAGEKVAAELEGVRGYGDYMEKYLARVTEATRTIKRSVRVPVICKIDPQMGDVVASALAMESGGADAVDAANIIGGTIPIDIFRGGRLRIPGATKAIITTVGAPSRPFVQGFVSRIAKSARIPVIGDGGLMDWQDVVEIIMLGAAAVSFCTVLLVHGFEALTKIENGLRKYMEEQGYRRIDDFKGLALANIRSDFGPMEIIPAVASVDQEKCSGCGLCLKPAHCLAIFMDNGTAAVDETECLGCGSCSYMCPEKAVSMRNI
jgi:dihydropyrimidine dehydrogenase (NAD+) subunit PreA